MASNLLEYVRVGAVFEKDGLARPVWFSLKGNKITISSICYKWKEKSKTSGEAIYKFSVSDGTTIYELCFVPADLKWILTAWEDYNKEYWEG